MKRTKISKIHLIMAALLLICLSSVASASADTPTLSHPSFMMSPHFTLWTDIHDNQTPVMTYNPQADEYMLVWTTVEGPLTTDVWARRIHANGTPDTWFNVDSSAAVKYEQPAIAFSPTQQEYMVAFTDNTDYTNTDIYARTFSGNGGSISARLEIDHNTLNQWHSDVAFNSQANEFLVAYGSMTASDEAEVIGRRYRLSDHTLLGKVTLASSKSGEYRSEPALAYNPWRNNYFMTYLFEDSNNHMIYLLGRTVSADLSGLGPEVEIASGTGPTYFSDVATGSDGYLVVFSDLGNIYGRLVGGDGTPTSMGGFPIPASTMPDYNYYTPGVAYLGSGTYLVTWNYFYIYSGDTADVFGQFVNGSSGTLFGPNMLMDTNPYLDRGPATACNTQATCLVAYEYNDTAYPGGDTDIRGRLVTAFKTYIPLAEK